MVENVDKFMQLLAENAEVAVKWREAQDNYPGSWEIREPFLRETMLPLADSLGLPFSLEELRKYETHKKLSHVKDDADSAGGVPEETVYYLIDQGWEDDPEIFTPGK